MAIVKAGDGGGVMVVPDQCCQFEMRRAKIESTGLDAVVIDLQDVGVRYWTYEAAMGYFLEAAAKSGMDIVVLDRPNPVTGSFVQGPVSDIGRDSYTNYMPLPVRHGMTFGELARYFNGERHLNASLVLVKMQGWQRGDWFDSTGLTWTNPSPPLSSYSRQSRSQLF